MDIFHGLLILTIFVFIYFLKSKNSELRAKKNGCGDLIVFCNDYKGKMIFDNNEAFCSFKNSDTGDTMKIGTGAESVYLREKDSFYKKKY